MRDLLAALRGQMVVVGARRTESDPLGEQPQEDAAQITTIEEHGPHVAESFAHEHLGLLDRLALLFRRPPN